MIDPLAKAANLWAAKVVSFVPKIVDTTIAKALKPYMEIESKHHELIEAHKLRIYRLEAMINDHNKEL